MCWYVFVECESRGPRPGTGQSFPPRSSKPRVKRQREVKYPSSKEASCWSVQKKSKNGHEMNEKHEDATACWQFVSSTLRNQNVASGSAVFSDPLTRADLTLRYSTGWPGRPCNLIDKAEVYYIYIYI